MPVRTFGDAGDNAAYDVIVIGAGAGGMSAALFAAIEGQSVLLIESTEFLGGTTALSAATVWVPNSMHAATVQDHDDIATARRFLDGVVGNHSSAEMRDAFLASGPDAIAALEAHTEVNFRPYATHPDYEQQIEGATLRGRSMEPIPFDGRRLGEALDLVRRPIPEFTIFGGMMVDRTDIGHLLGLTKSMASLAHATKIIGRYGVDRLIRSRGSRLVMGNALVGRLLKSLLDRNVDIVTQTKVQSFVTDADGVAGVVANCGGVTRTIRANVAVVLAAGGYNRSKARRAEMLSSPTPEYSPAAPGHTGAMQDLALGLGARFGDGNADNAFWAPVSVRKRNDGTTAVFPHFVLDRSKPGTVCVNQRGERFVNESTSYHAFARAMFEAHKTSPCIPCFIVTDAVGLKKYGLGMVRMGTRKLAPYLADGYLTEAASVTELAQKLAMDPVVLTHTVATMNTYAKTGIDPGFGRGATAYHRHNGDAAHGPNPCLGPVTVAPFYAVRLYPGDIGAATGLVIDPWAQVVKAGDVPVGRLYACGNEANSVMGGTYPGPGITIGPAITFAYRAIQHAVRGAKVSNTGNA
jgi:succinate dehydrogenase/fumarate reductase flavoprotein subunit